MSLHQNRVGVGDCVPSPGETLATWSLHLALLHSKMVSQTITSPGGSSEL